MELKKNPGVFERIRHPDRGIFTFCKCQNPEKVR